MATEKQYTQDEMADWLKNKVKAVASGTARRKLLSFRDRARDSDSAFVGNLYFFRYDPKHKATLPQYDKFPMAIILQWNSDGFLGLNLHYLPKGQRSAMLGVFSKYKEDYKLEKDSDSDNWENLVDYLDNTNMDQMPKQCLKRYLWSHVTSHFVEVYPDEYGIAVQLPVEDWVFKR